MPSYEELQNQIMQEEALSGRRIAHSRLRALNEADLKAQYARVVETAKIGLLNRELTMKEKEAKAQASAAKMSGGIQLGGLGLMGYGTYKYFKPTPGAEVLPGTAATEIPFHAPGLLTAQSGAAGPLNVPAAATPSLTGIPSLTPPAITPIPPITPTVAPGLLSTAGTALPVVGWAGAAGTAGGLLARSMGANKELSAGAGALAGAATGAMMGSAIPGIGTVIGGVIGLVSGALPNLFGGKKKVICTELYRQGFLSRKIHRLDEKYAKMYIDNDTLRGYHLWAKPVAYCMTKSKLITYIVYPIGKAWAHEMAHRIDPDIKGSYLGRFLNRVGVPVCRWIGRRRKKNG